MRDLTKGNITKVILQFAIPIFIGNLFNLAYNLADTRIIGTYLGNDALAAVGSVSKGWVAFCPDLGKSSAQPVRVRKRPSSSKAKKIRNGFIRQMPPIINRIWQKLYHIFKIKARKQRNV